MSLLSFGLKRSSKSNGVKRKVEAVDRVFASDFEDDAATPKRLVIPKQENSFRPGSKQSFVPSFVPHSRLGHNSKREEERFEAAKVKEDTHPIHYGLQSRPPETGLSGTPEFTSEGTAAANEKDDTESFRAEVNALPDEAGVEAYERMPVEGFGLAMLKGMDWKEGQVLGRRKDKAAVEAIEYVPRMSRLGLGAVPDASKQKKKPMMVLPQQPDGRVRHVRTLDEKLVPFEAPRLKAGDIRKIMSGAHEGLTCTILKIREGDVIVRLRNEEEVNVHPNELGDVIATSEVSLHKSKKQRQIRSVDDDIQGDVDGHWLTTGIRVRVVDKLLGNGDHYLKKGVVVDIMRPGVAHLLMDEGQRIEEDVRQSSLETVVPRKPEAVVKIVKGPLKGTKGKLLQRKSDKALGVVQLLSDLSVHRVAFDDMAEYV